MKSIFKLPQKFQAQFARIHKTCLINLDFLGRVEGGRVFLGKTKLPIGAMYRKEFLKKVGA